MPLAVGESENAGPVLAETMKATMLGAEERNLADPQIHGGTRYRAFRDGEHVELDEVTRERLRQLGYIE